MILFSTLPKVYLFSNCRKSSTGWSFGKLLLTDLQTPMQNITSPHDTARLAEAIKHIISIKLIIEIIMSGPYLQRKFHKLPISNWVFDGTVDTSPEKVCLD